MKMVKSLLLGSAAAFVAFAGAQAADLPVKAKPVEYVKVCSLYGAGFYYIPGTDTCIRYSGFIRYEANFHSQASGAQDVSVAGTPQTTGMQAANNFNQNYYFQRVRVAWLTDTRTQTEYGTLRSFSYLYFTNSGGDGNAGTAPTLLQGYIQLAGFTVGKFKSAFFTPWSSNAGTYNGALFYPDDAGASTGVAYTWQFGNGVSATINVTDPRRTTLWQQDTAINAGPTIASMGNKYISGFHAPDILANIQVDQAWGFFHVGGVLHELAGGYYGNAAANAVNSTTAVTALETSGRPDTRWGWGVNAGLNLKNLPTGAGDQLFLNAAYTDGATAYQTNNSPNTGVALFGPGNPAGLNALNQTMGFSFVADGVYVNPNSGIGGNAQIQTIKVWTAQAAFEHFWIPAKLKSSLYGYGGYFDFGAAQTIGAANPGQSANQIICSRFTPGFANQPANSATFTAGSNCNFNFGYWAVGSRTTWYPVKDLEIAADVGYTQYQFANAGQASIVQPTATGNTVNFPTSKPAGIYNIANQGVLSGYLRVVRSW